MENFLTYRDKTTVKIEQTLNPEPNTCADEQQVQTEVKTRVKL